VGVDQALASESPIVDILGNRRGLAPDIGAFEWASALAGDFNTDGEVDGADLVQWRGDFGINGESDADNDGDSDGADFLIWQRQLGGSPVVGSGALAPEPASWALVGLALGGCAAANRPRRAAGPCAERA
jgi:hypothetical protein